MKWSRVLKYTLAAAIAAFALHAQGVLAKDKHAADAGHAMKAEAKADAGAQQSATAARVVKLEVTENGFEPSPIKLKKDEPVDLRVTRKTDKTCATELVMKDYNVDVQLPMNEEVAIHFTPTKSGTLKYGCAMGQMVAGQFVIE